MIRMMGDRLHDLRCWLFGCRVDHDDDDPTPVKTPIEERFDRIEQRIDSLIIEKAGRDFLDAAMTNREGRRT